MKRLKNHIVKIEELSHFKNDYLLRLLKQNILDTNKELIHQTLANNCYEKMTNKKMKCGLIELYRLPMEVLEILYYDLLTEDEEYRHIISMVIKAKN
jgi:hypothetical protein